MNRRGVRPLYSVPGVDERSHFVFEDFRVGCQPSNNLLPMILGDGASRRIEGHEAFPDIAGAATAKLQTVGLNRFSDEIVEESIPIIGREIEGKSKAQRRSEFLEFTAVEFLSQPLAHRARRTNLRQTVLVQNPDD